MMAPTVKLAIMTKARRRRRSRKARERNDLIEEVCVHLEGLPYHKPGVRREMARMLRGRLKTREEEELRS